MPDTIPVTTSLPRNGPQKVVPLLRMSLQISRLKALAFCGYVLVAINSRTSSMTWAKNRKLWRRPARSAVFTSLL